MLKLRCPACGKEGPLEDFSQAADLLNLSKAAGAFGDDWPLVLEYLDCFRGRSGKALQGKKLLRLAREVWQMWHTGGFNFGQAYYRVGREEFREALRATCNQVTPGLTNHNYLKKVLVGAAERTSQRQEREHRAKEEGLRTTGRDSGAGLRTTGGTPVPLEEGPDDLAYRAEIIRLSRVVRLARTPEDQEAASAALKQFVAGIGAGQESDQ